MILILFYFVTVHSHNLEPLICNAQEAKISYDLTPKIECNILTSDKKVEVFKANAVVYKRNIAKHESMAHKCRKVKTVLKAYTLFARWRVDHERTDEDVFVDFSECLQMIRDRRCEARALLGTANLAYTENKSVYPWQSGNAWDCNQWKETVIYNCYLTQGKVYQSIGQQMKSNLGNVAECKYNEKRCNLPDKAQLIWETTTAANCEYTNWQEFSGTSWDNVFMDSEKEYVFTTKNKADPINACNNGKVQLVQPTEQGFGIYITRTRTNFRSGNAITKSARQKRTDKSEAWIPILNALEVRIHEALVESLTAHARSRCLEQKRNHEIDLLLANSEPMLIGRYLTGDNHTMASLSGRILNVWSCVPVESYVPLKMGSVCTNYIPMNVTLRGHGFKAYMDAKTNILYRSAAPVDCDLTHEMMLHDSNGLALVYNGATGGVSEFHGTIIPHPLYASNFTIYADFKKVIHKSSSMYSMDELRGQISFNDLYAALDENAAIMKQLAGTALPTEDHEQAKQILDRLQSLTPWGFISSFGHKMLNVWIYICCSIVTIKFIWSILVPIAVKKAIAKATTKVGVSQMMKALHFRKPRTSAEGIESNPDEMTPLKNLYPTVPNAPSEESRVQLENDGNIYSARFLK